jgi:hypothetical protein
MPVWLERPGHPKNSKILLSAYGSVHIKLECVMLFLIKSETTLHLSGCSKGGNPPLDSGHTHKVTSRLTKENFHEIQLKRAPVDDNT